MEQLKHQDAQFLFIETGDSLTHVTSAAIYDPSTAPGKKIRFKDIIAHLESRLHTSPVFRRKLVRVPLDLDFPYWVEDEYFEIEHHIRHGRLPEPGDWRQFCIHLARYHNRPMDMHRPLWEMYVVEGLDKIDGIPKGSFAVFTKIHHCTIDGVSAVKFFAALNDDVTGAPAGEAPDFDLSDLRAPRPAEMARRALVSNFASPVKLANTMLRASPQLVKGVAEKVITRQQESDKISVPDTRFNGSVSPHKMFYAVEFPLADFKEIKKAVDGATVNDVVLAVCGGALRRYLTAHEELPDESLVVMAPVNARPKSPSPEDNLPGNNITTMTVRIYTTIEDPLECLRAISADTRKTKAAKDGQPANLMTDVTRHIPAATQVAAARLMLNFSSSVRMNNLMVSNVPGAQESMYLCGAKQVGNYGLAPLGQGMGLFIATPSYAGKMGFNVISTREIMPDIEFFVDCLRDSFNALKAATVPKRKRPKAKSKARRAGRAN